MKWNCRLFQKLPKRPVWLPRSATAAMLVVCVGCGQNSHEPPKGTVRGHVTSQGKPVPSAYISFVANSTGVGTGAETDANGDYAITREFWVGNYVVTISPPGPAASDHGWRAPLSKAEYEKLIPAKYHFEGSTPLRFELQEGPNEFNCELAP